MPPTLSSLVQVLEPRRLLASAALVDGVLLVYGTAGNDKIVVGGTAGIAVPASASSIVVHGARGNDAITIDPSVTLPTRIFGDAGDDTITGGSGPDRISAGDGNDVISAGDAKDTVYGEAGDDYIRGGGGTDLCDGGDGRDTILADAGNDHLYGGANPDNLRGGAGNDDLHGGGGGDALHGEDGDDFLAGDKAADHFFPGRGDNLCDARSDDFILDSGLTKSGAATITLTSNSTYIRGTTGKLDANDNTMIINGQTVVGDATGALVMYTYGGDANGDGKIDVNDYGRIDNTGSSGWFNGDFNYDGKVNADDYGIIGFNVGPGFPVPQP